SIPGPLSGLLPPITYKQFLLALLIVTALPYMIACFANLECKRGVGVNLLLCLQVVMLINVFAHAGMAGMMGGDVPGVVTALGINLPFSIYLLRRAIIEEWASRRALALLGPIGLVLHGLGLPGIIILSGIIVRGV